jgi:hypothetical protein
VAPHELMTTGHLDQMQCIYQGFLGKSNWFIETRANGALR